jgi:hypothetical protein
MARKLSDRFVDAMPWLDNAAESLRRVVAPVVGESSPRAIKDLLVGTWLGHPLHPAIVQLWRSIWRVRILPPISWSGSGWQARPGRW